MSCPQNIGQNNNTKIATKSFENSEKFKYLGTTITHLVESGLSLVKKHKH